MSARSASGAEWTGNRPALVLLEPGKIALRDLAAQEPGPEDVVVHTRWSGISAGTERLLWRGEMPSFPGLSYPLVPGYESVGDVVWAGPRSGRDVGDLVFVPGSRCHIGATGLFGATASRLVVTGERTHPVQSEWGADATLIALAATAFHALGDARDRAPELIIGHGTLGRLLARITIALGNDAPTVWETDASRRSSSAGYEVVAPTDDARADYRSIIDVSGDNAILDTLVARGTRGVEIALAGFYGAPLSFTFPPAFMREARVRIAAEFTPSDIATVIELVERGSLDLSGLVSHRADATDAANAYAFAFGDRACRKMVLDWSDAR